FQAEDGIRDFHVTGVQTCALPIYPGIFRSPAAFAISWAESSCAFLIASLKAACRRSSNISRSSRVSGSNVTFLTSKVPLISTTTAPPPAVAVTVFSASSSWIFSIRACIFPNCWRAFCIFTLLFLLFCFDYLAAKETQGLLDQFRLVSGGLLIFLLLKDALDGDLFPGQPAQDLLHQAQVIRALYILAMKPETRRKGHHQAARAVTAGGPLLQQGLDRPFFPAHLLKKPVPPGRIPGLACGAVALFRGPRIRRPFP